MTNLVERLRNHELHAVHDEDDDCEEAAKRIAELEVKHSKFLDEFWKTNADNERLRAAAQSLLKWMKDDPGGWYSEDCERIWNDLEAALREDEDG